MGFASQSFPSVLVPPAFAGGDNSGNVDNNASALPSDRDANGTYGYQKYTPDPKTEESEVGLLARVIYAEAGSEPGGPEAVGWVVRNRVDADPGSGFKHDVTYRDAILRRGQFASVGGDRWNKFTDPKSLAPGDLAMYKKAWTAARQVYSGQIPDPTNGATFFRTYKGERAPEGFRVKGGNIFWWCKP